MKLYFLLAGVRVGLLSSRLVAEIQRKHSSDLSSGGTQLQCICNVWVGILLKSISFGFVSDIYSLIVSLISCEPGVTVLIVLGTVMVILVMFGDYGACNEKRTALQVVRLFPPTQELPPLLYVVAKSVSTLVFISTDEITKFTLHLTEAIVWELHRTALLDSLSLT